MKIQENSKKFNIFLQILMCFFIEIWPKNDILTQKKLRKIPGIQPTYARLMFSHLSDIDFIWSTPEKKTHEEFRQEFYFI